MIDSAIRWLHLSDIRSGKNRTTQSGIFLDIVEHVRKKISAGFVPDLLFVTGDIANTGADDEYSYFQSKLLSSLQRTIKGIEGRTFIVPGNHDVDRAKNRGFDRVTLLSSDNPFFRAGEEGRREREIVQPRFESYRENITPPARESWVGSALGCQAKTCRVGTDKTVGVVLTNTAWLSQGDQDYRRLTPGSMLVERALAQVARADLRFVLGHHPLEWFDPDEGNVLSELFRVHRVIYLHGHLRYGDAPVCVIKKSWPVSFQGWPVCQFNGEQFSLSGLAWGQASFIEKKIWFERHRWTPGNDPLQDESGGDLPEEPREVHFDRFLDVPLFATRFTRRTRNNRIVYEHAQRAEDEDVGKEGLGRSPMLVDEALAVFNRVLLLSESGGGVTFAVQKLFRTLMRAVEANDASLIREKYPDWRHASLPMPLKVDAPEFSEWLSEQPLSTNETDVASTAESRAHLLLRYATEAWKGLPTHDLVKDLPSLKAYCHRESFVLLVEEWGALNPRDAELVNAVIRDAGEMVSRHRPAIIYSAAFDSAGYTPPFDDRHFERISIAKLGPQNQEQFVERYCLLHGQHPGAFSPILDSLRHLADTPGALKTLLDEWRRRGFPPQLEGIAGIGDLYQLKILAALGPNSEGHGLAAVEPLAKALLQQYLSTPSARLLKFRASLQPETQDYLEASGFLRLHRDGQFSIRQLTLQDYIAGWALSTQAEDRLKELLGELLAHQKVRREPIKCGLFWLWRHAEKTQVIADTIEVLLAHKENSSAIATIADLVVAAGRQVQSGPIQASLARVRDQFTRLVTDASVDSINSLDRFIIGRALAFCGDDRKGIGLNAALDVPDIEWKEVAGGQAELGQTDRDLELYEETRIPPNDEKRITQLMSPFLLSKYPVTNGQFHAFVRDPIFGYDCKGPWRELERPIERKWKLEPGTENHPVASVSWDEARAFCVWYSRMTGRGVNLPRSAQWEYAARGSGQDWLFPFPFDNSDVSGRVNSQEEGLPGVTAAGVFPKSDSPFQISDMCGNVFEWCEDEHRSDQPDFKVTKGGSYNHDLLRCRNATRGKKHRRSQHPYLGFRLYSTAQDRPRPRVVLAGSGFAGACTAIRLMALAGQALEIVMVDTDTTRMFGGLAYSSGTAYWEHLFNLQAGRVSLYREDRDDFVNWLNTADNSDWHEQFRQQQFEPTSAVPRRLYQRYLKDRVREVFEGAHESVSLRLIQGQVIGVKEGLPNRVVIRQEGGREIDLECEQLFLCTGNVQVQRPEFLTKEVCDSGRYFDDQYTDQARKAFAGLRDTQKVLVLGSGLRAYDVVMTLYSNLSDLRDSGATVTLVSRHRRIHPRYENNHRHGVIDLPMPEFVKHDFLSPAEVVEGVQEAYQAALKSPLLAHTPELLKGERILKAWEKYVPEAMKKLTGDDVKALLKEYRSLITVHRIGVVRKIAVTVQDAQDKGLCRILAAEVDSVSLSGSQFEVRFKDRPAELFDLIVNCLGREQDYGKVKMTNELWGNLFSQGLARRHEITGVGVDVDGQGRLRDTSGRASSWIGAVGVMREGVELENNGRLGSFSFTLGPIKNQAFEAAFDAIRRLEGEPRPSLELRKKIPARDGSGTKELVSACIDEAFGMELRELRERDRNQLKLRIDADAAWRLVVDWLKSRTYRRRLELSPAIEHFQEETATALQEAGVGTLEQQGRFVRCLWRCLEEVALGHLTRLDEVQPGEGLDVEDLPSTGTPAARPAGVTQPVYDFALSFAGEDRQVAEDLAWRLKKAGARVFYYPNEQAELLGKNLVQETQAIFRDRSKYCVVFISQHYPRKPWTMLELEHAQARALQETEYILLLKLDDTKIPGISDEVRDYIDLRKHDLDHVCELLLGKLSRLPRRGAQA